MFRKPKNKSAIRQRKAVEDEDTESATNDEQQGPIENNPPRKEKEFSAAQSKFSFDMDEGADSTFEVKKNKKKVEELKRAQRLEEAAEAFEKERKKEEEDRKKNLEKIVKKEKQSKFDKTTKNERDKYLEKYKDQSAKHVGGYDEDLDIDEECFGSSDVTRKFSSTLGGIPDSKAVYEAKKRRERLRREGREGYIPLDDDQKIRSKQERGRLIREDDNDDSDEEEPNRFYSARELLKTEEDRRRQEQNEFLNRENREDLDDYDDNHYSKARNEEDDEMEEWERQQILKAVSGRAIGQLRNERRNTAKILGGKLSENNYDEKNTEMDMDIDMDIDFIPDKPSFNHGPSNTGGDIKIEDILAKLKLRIEEREEAMNYRREEKRKMEENIEENKGMINKIEMELPELSTKFTMYQELRVYSRSLLECLNEKVGEINEIADKKRQCAKNKCIRLIKRRRQDVKDQYSECATSAVGKTMNKTGEVAGRIAEREARRGRRRRDRESTLVGIVHEDGLSTDDEEMTGQAMADGKICDEVEAVASVIFADALEEYSDLKKVLERILDWLAVDTKSFQDAYVHLCLPKLCSPYVRLQLITADILNNDVSINQMQWFKDALMAGVENTEINQEHEVLIGLIPAIIEKVVVPFLIDVIKDEWDPMSSKQTRKLMGFCAIFEKIPSLTEKSKSFVAFLEAIREKIVNTINDDIFIPMFSPTAFEVSSTGCRAFLDRQFWTTMKLIKNINCLSSLISQAARFELIVEKIVNTSLTVAIRSGLKNEITAERKLVALFGELDDKLLLMGGMTSFRLLKVTLNDVAEAQRQAGRSFHRDISKFLEKIER